MNHNTDNPVAIDRFCAASLVRSARVSDNHRASENLDWALFLAPQSRSIERARIRLFLQEGNIEAAESLITRAMLSRPDDLQLQFLRAQCMAARKCFSESDALMRCILAQKPTWCAALELAADVASQQGEYGRAIAFLERALIEQPCNDRIIANLSEALLDAGEMSYAIEAESLLLSIGDPPPELFARALIVQGRVLDAIDYLEARLNTVSSTKYRAPSTESHTCSDDTQRLDRPSSVLGTRYRFPEQQQYDALLTQYVTALESAGHIARIDKLLDAVTPAECPQTANALARIMLAQGKFRAAIALTLSAVRSPLFTRRPSSHITKNEQRRTNTATRLSALPILYVSAIFANRSRLADRAWSQISHTALSTQHTERLCWIDCWRRGFRGQMIHDQRTAAAKPIGCDPASSILQPLLKNAARIFEKQIRTAPDDMRDCANDLALCRAARAKA